MISLAGRLLFRGSAELAVLTALLAVMMGIARQYDATAFTNPSILALFVQVLPLAFAAMAQAVVMLTRGIDLSVGSVLAVAMAMFALHAGRSGGGVVIAALLALGVCLVAGLVNGCLVAVANLPPIIVTLSTSFLWGGIALWILPQPGGSVPQGLHDAYTKGWHGLAMPIFILGAVLVVWKTISRTRFGLAVYAIGGNPHGAYANGVPVRAVTVGAYLMASLFVGLAGIALAVQTGSADATIGTPYTLNSITACILGGVIFLGGVGYLRGAVLGAFTVSVLANILLFTGISPFYQLVVQGAILIAAVAVKTLLSADKVVV